MKHSILMINSSGRSGGSITRELSDNLLTKLMQQHKNSQVVHRDVANGLPFIDERWIGANFTAEEDRNEQHKLALALSDQLVDELKSTDTLIIASPIYNFGIPATLKAWIDLIARARLTFKYTENGPQGLLTGKKAYVVIASGGVPLNSAYDFVTPYLKHVLGFIGITDVTLVNANDFELADPMATDEKLSALLNAA